MRAFNISSSMFHRIKSTDSKGDENGNRVSLSYIIHNNILISPQNHFNASNKLLRSLEVVSLCADFA